MDPDVRNNRLIRLHLKGLSVIGLVRFTDTTVPYFAVFRCYFAMAYLTLFNATQYLYVYENRNDLMNIATRGGTVILYTSLMLKGFSSTVYNKTYNAIMTDMQETMKKIETDGQEPVKEILNQFVDKNRTMNRGVFMITAGSVGFFNIYLIAVFFFLHGPGEHFEIFAIAVYLPFAVEDHRVFVFFYVEVILIIICIIMILWNTMVVSLLVYVQCMLRIVGCRIKHFTEFSEEKDHYIFLTQCMEDHIKTTMHLKQIGHLIKVPMNLDFLIMAVILLAELFLMSVIPMGIEMIITWAYIATIFTIFFMFYWYANEVLLESTKVSDAAFESAWLDAEPRCKRAILLIIQRAQRPLIMRAGLHPMNLSTLLMVLRTTYSAFALLRQITGHDSL